MIVPVEAVQVTPAFRVVSPVTTAAKVWLAPPMSVAVGGLTLTEMGVKATAAVPDLVVSVLLVAVIVAVVVVTGVGAVYTPADVMVPTDAVHVTPALAESAVTVAANVCVAPATSVAVGGLTVTEIGVRVMVALADLVASNLLVAVTVADVAVMTAGAVYIPAEVMVPGEADQVTPALVVSFATVAEKVCEAPPMSVAVVGLTVTEIAGAEEPHPAMKV